MILGRGLRCILLRDLVARTGGRARNLRLERAKCKIILVEILMIVQLTFIDIILLGPRRPHLSYRHHDCRCHRRWSRLGDRGQISTSVLGPRGAVDPVDPDSHALAPARPEKSFDRVAVSSQGIAGKTCSASQRISRLSRSCIDRRRLPRSKPYVLGRTGVHA